MLLSLFKFPEFVVRYFVNLAHAGRQGISYNMEQNANAFCDRRAGLADNYISVLKPTRMKGHLSSCCLKFAAAVAPSSMADLR